MSNNDHTIRAAGADPPAVDQAYETDAALAERLQRDAVQLMDQLYSGAVRLTQSRPDAEDLVQETMLHAYIGFRSFRAGTNQGVAIPDFAQHLDRCLLQTAAPALGGMAG